VPFLSKDLKDIIILGSWYGLNGMLLRQKIDNDIKIWNVDSDPLCKKYGKMLQSNNSDYKHNYSIHDDALDHFFTKTENYQLIINTSCEHMEPEDIKLIVGAKPKDTMICFKVIITILFKATLIRTLA